MIKVVAKNNIQEGKLEEILDLYKELVEKTVIEPGCIKYELYQDINNPRILTMIEEWESIEALDAHEKTEHFVRIFPLLKDLVTDESDFRIYKKLI
jgi:quinol monooxygenase YgiN